jgi:hypothetical protein
MTGLLAFQLYRTENVTVDGNVYIARFTKRTDGLEYALFMIDETNTKQWHCSYSADTAKDFEGETGEALEKHVLEILKGDIQRGVTHAG